MSTNDPQHPLSRRTALAGLSAAGLGLALTATGRGASAQEETGDLAGHPLTGTWAVWTLGGIVPQIHGADGSLIAASPPNYVDPALGLTFQGPALGRWEADGERTGHFTFIQALSDANGTYVGTFQLAAELEVGADGQTWSATTMSAHIIVRDAANNVLIDQELSFDSPVTGTRIGATIESVVLPVVTPTATPAS
jgi:hypothetical protein